MKKATLMVVMKDGNRYPFGSLYDDQPQFEGASEEEFIDGAQTQLLNSITNNNLNKKALFGSEMSVNNGFIRFDSEIYNVDQIVKAYVMFRTEEASQVEVV